MRSDYNERSSTTNPETRDQTRTPQWVFDGLNRKYQFQADLACLPETALCERYLTPEQDSLKTPWGEVMGDNKRAPFGWLNPPYSKIGPWCQKAEQERANGIGCVMLVPLDKSAKWYGEAKPDQVIELVGDWDTLGDFGRAGKWHPGRISFIDAVTGEEIKGNPKGSMFLVYLPSSDGAHKQLLELSVVELMYQGEAYK